MNKFLLAALLATLSSSAFAADAQADNATRSEDELRAREIFARIISFKTSVGLGNVPAMANYLADQFRAAGFADADIHVLPLGETASLVVRYRGDGTGGRPILLMSHMDVVTAKPEDWQRDPFTLVEENGYFFGRGTSDIKNGVAALTSTFLRLKSENFKPSRDLIILFSGDEETTGASAQDLVRNHRDLIDAEYALNSDGGGGDLDEKGQPLTYGVQAAEKTYASFELTVRNAGGHSSWPRKDNAIYELADALKRTQAYRFPVSSNEITIASFRAAGKVTKGPLGEAMTRFANDPGDEAAIDLLSAEPSQVGLVRTTCVPTLLRAGHADNALPQSATATLNCRIFPGVTVEAVHKTLREVAGTGVEVVSIGAPMASDASPLRADVMAAVTKAVHARYPGTTVVPSQAAGATDGLYLRAGGIPTYGVSGMLMKESDSFAHGLNERIPVQGFYNELEHWHVLVTELAGPVAANAGKP